MKHIMTREFVVVEGSTKNMWYYAEITDAQTGKPVDFILKPTMREVHQRLEQDGYRHHSFRP